MLKKIFIKDFKTKTGKNFDSLPLSYQIFGKELGKAPVVMINHALTGNSNVTGDHGWWNEIVGFDKTIDLHAYTVICFNIIGNGYDGFFLENYQDITAKDIAKIFLIGLEELNIQKLDSLVGASLGGGIAWEILALKPNIASKFVAIASDWKATDWIIGNCLIQEHILNNSNNPIHDARLHAMLCYRTPKSINQRFERTLNSTLNVFNIESWLLHHGKKLQQRFQLQAYKTMNQLLKTIDISRNQNIDFLNSLNTDIHIIGIDSDIFFSAEEDKKTCKQLQNQNCKATYHELKSIHGHDSFLIENIQLHKILEPIFNKTTL